MKKSILLPLIALFVSLSMSLEATTINVPADVATLREAVNLAQSGDTINLSAGTHILFPPNIGRGLSIGFDLTVTGAGSSLTQLILNDNIWIGAYSPVSRFELLNLACELGPYNDSFGFYSWSQETSVRNCVFTGGRNQITAISSIISVSDCVFQDSLLDSSWTSVAIRSLKGEFPTEMHVKNCHFGKYVSKGIKIDGTGGAIEINSGLLTIIDSEFKGKVAVDADNIREIDIANSTFDSCYASTENASKITVAGNLFIETNSFVIPATPGLVAKITTAGVPYNYAINNNTFIECRNAIWFYHGSGRDPGTMNLFNNSFFGNECGLSALIYDNNADVICRSNLFDGNDTAIYCYQNGHVDAGHNWFGDVSGPYNPISNPTGLGDPVSHYVSFEPWLKDPSEAISSSRR